MFRFHFLIVLIFSLSTCSSQVAKVFLKEAKVVQTNTKKKNVCNNVLNYIPDLEHLNHTPNREVKVNFHFICNSEGKGNFSEKEGVEYVDVVLGAANGNMWKNQQMLLPEGNDTPIIPTLYKYILTPKPDDPTDDGIYFHNDDEYYFILNKGKDRNNYDKGVFEKYGIQKGEVLNIFIQDNHLDSLKSSTYESNMNGIAFLKEGFVKCSMWYYNMQDVQMKNGKPFYPKKWLAHKQLNHEIGHVLGLRHTWRGNDGCDDTPHHPNCWGRTETPPCNEFSNNVMDYNPLRNAWTPCQIGIAHQRMTQRENVRNLLIKKWCKKQRKPIVIKEKIEWNSCKDLESDIIIENGGELTIRCRVSLPKEAKIEIKPEGKLILDGGRLHNDCGDQWEGIEVWKKGKKSGMVELFDEATIEDAKYSVELLSKE